MLHSSKYNVRIGKWELNREFDTKYREVVYDQTGGVSPLDIFPATAIVAKVLAMALEVYALPSGTVHLAQQIESKNTVEVGDIVEVWGRPSRSIVRGNWRYQSIEFIALNENKTEILSGKTTVMVPNNE